MRVDWKSVRTRTKSLPLLFALWFSVCAGCSSSLPFLRNASETAEGDMDVRLVSVARLAERQGDRARAKELYRGLIVANRELRTAHHRMGVIAAREKDMDLAMQHFEAARIAGLDSPDLHVDMAFAEFLAGRSLSAETRLAEVLKQEPNNRRALNNLAILRGTQGKFSESLALSQKAVGSAKAHANLGYLLAQFGDVKQATDSYHIALGQNPELNVAANALLQLDQVAAKAPIAPLALELPQMPEVKSVELPAVEPPEVERETAANAQLFGGVRIERVSANTRQQQDAQAAGSGTRTMRLGLRQPWLGGRGAQEDAVQEDAAQEDAAADGDDSA